MKTEGITTPEVRPRFGIQPGDPVWLAIIRVGGRHLGAFAALLLIPPNASLVALLIISYLIRIWAMEAVYHRYFAHAAYRTNRYCQWLLALLGTQCGQRGPLWWAATHRTHHRYADTPLDPHSPAAHGFLHAHARWLTNGRQLATDLEVVADYARFPELRWLNKYYYVPLYLAVPMLYWCGDQDWLGSDISGLAAVLWGGYLPTTLALHMTSFVNSLGHMPGFPGGYRRYPKLNDGSMNRPVLGVLTLGAGWHNNHHRFGTSARTGFAWYELDMVFWSLWLLQKFGVIFALKSAVPEAILREGGLAPRGAPEIPLTSPAQISTQR